MEDEASHVAYLTTQLKPCNVGNWKGFGRGLSCNRYCLIIFLENEKVFQNCDCVRPIMCCVKCACISSL